MGEKALVGVSLASAGRPSRGAGGTGGPEAATASSRASARCLARRQNRQAEDWSPRPRARLRSRWRLAPAEGAFGAAGAFATAGAAGGTGLRRLPLRASRPACGFRRRLAASPLAAFRRRRPSLLAASRLRADSLSGCLRVAVFVAEVSADTFSAPAAPAVLAARRRPSSRRPVALAGGLLRLPEPLASAAVRPARPARRPCTGPACRRDASRPSSLQLPSFAGVATGFSLSRVLLAARFALG